MFKRFFVLIVLSAVLFILASTIAHAAPGSNPAYPELLNFEASQLISQVYMYSKCFL